MAKLALSFITQPLGMLVGLERSVSVKSLPHSVGLCSAIDFQSSPKLFDQPSLSIGFDHVNFPNFLKEPVLNLNPQLIFFHYYLF
jgi:hypothetical protein